jgi:hypothetical protein
VKAWLIACALAALSTLPGSAAADSGGGRLVAIVTEVDGSARILVRGRTFSPEVADPVQDGAIVVLEQGARIVLTYPVAGSIYELQGPGRFVAHSDAVESRSRSGRLAKRDLVPALRALRIRPEGSTLQGSAAMRGGTVAQLQVDGPNGSLLTRDAISLCWKPLGPQWIYRVRLIDDDGNVVFEAQTPDSVFQLPSTVPLDANAAYLWHVLATGPNAQSAEAAGEFRRLDPDSEQVLLQAESLMPQLDVTERILLRIARQQRGLAPEGVSGCHAGASEH